MAGLKARQWEQLCAVDTAREAAELWVLEVQSSQEKRVSSLEARLSELSESLGGYEKARQQDQTALAAMRDRVQMLDTENQELSAASTSPEPAALPEEPEGPLEQVLRLKSLLLETRPLEELEPAFRLPGPEDVACDGCRLLQERLEVLEMQGPLPGSTMEPPRAQAEELEALRAAREELLGQLTALEATEQEGRRAAGGGERPPD